MNPPEKTTGELFSTQGPLAELIDGYVERYDQLLFADEALRAIKAGQVLLAEAGTGTGKTLAYLAAAVMCGKKVVISTATKTLQDQILERDIPLLRKALSIDISAVLLKGRENYLCLRRFGRYRKQTTLDIGGSAGDSLSHWAVTTETGDRAELTELPEAFDDWGRISATSESCIGQKCTSYDKCFLFKRRKLAQRARIVVVNHHLFFADLAVRAASGGEVLPRYSVVIFDEGHHLEAVSTQYFGTRISSHQFAELVRDAVALWGAPKHIPEPCAVSIDGLERSVQSFWASLTAPEGSRRLKGGLKGEPGKRLIHLEGAITQWLAAMGKAAPAHLDTDGLERRGRSLLADLGLFKEKTVPGEVRWFERRGRIALLTSVPVDVAETLSKLLFKPGLPVIITSATLRVGGDFSYLRSRLGVPEGAGELVAGGSFDYEHNCMVYVPEKFADPNSNEFPQAVADEIERIVGETRGRAFCLFTSYRVLNEAAARLKGRLPYTLLVQGDAPRNKLLDDFRNDTSSVLLGAQSFWEGVDVPGEALSAVIIDRLPFSSPGDPLVEARIEKITSEGHSAFAKYQLPVAAMALRQGFGRLIRRTDDRGIVAILDRRFLERSYGGYFKKSLPKAPITSDFSSIKRFLK